MRFLTFLAILFLSCLPHRDTSAMGTPSETCFLAARQRGLPADGLLLLVEVATQSLAVCGQDGVLRRYAVSTAVAGVGNRMGSHRTPLGWHRIVERIGGTEPPGRVFVSRVPQPQRLGPEAWRNPDSGDFVLTRILWLRGLEPGVNAGPGIDSYERTIYLHGTNQEHLLGQPASHGCIRLSNRDVMELFDLVQGHEAWCLIVEQTHPEAP